MKDNRVLEIFFSMFFLVLVIIFVAYVFINTPQHSGGSYCLHAKFNNIGVLQVGSPVVIKGIQIGKITDISLSSDDYMVDVVFTISSDIKIPKTSQALITSQGLMGGGLLDIIPSSGSKDYLSKGMYIKNTKDWQSLEDKIGSIFLK